MDRTDPIYQQARETYGDLWPYPLLRELPCYVLNGSTAYAPDAQVPADCLNAEDPTDNQPASVDELAYYPSVQYRFMSLVTGDTIRESVVTWRITNALFLLAIASVSLLLSRPEHRRPMAIAWLISSVPLGLFLAASFNPSAWAVGGTAAVIGPLLALVSQPWQGSESGLRILFIAFCAVMVAGSRSEGIGLLAVALLTVLVLGARLPEHRRSQIAPTVWVALCGSALAAAGVLLAVNSTKIRGLVGAIALNVNDDAASRPMSLWEAVLSALPLYSNAHSSALGWLEIGMPAVVGILGGAAFWGAGFFGLGVVNRRKISALVLLVVVMILVPAVIALSGRGLQPRYVLPLVYVFAFALLVPPVGKVLPEMNRVQRGALVLALTIANSMALLQTTVRYVSGLTPGSADPWVFAAQPVPEWWWDYWLSPLLNWVVGSFAFSLGCFLLLRNPGPLYSPTQGSTAVVGGQSQPSGQWGQVG